MNAGLPKAESFRHFPSGLQNTLYQSLENNELYYKHPCGRHLTF